MKMNMKLVSIHGLLGCDVV